MYMQLIFLRNMYFYPASVEGMGFGKILRRTLEFQWLSAGHTLYTVSPPDWNTRSPVEAGGKEMDSHCVCV